MLCSNLVDDVLLSLSCRDGNVNSLQDVLSWIKNLNENTHVSIDETAMSEDSFWFYDDYRGEILNRKRSFFSITGLRYFIDNQLISEQPIIIQNEIGYLGIIAKKINGVLNFLMQAKIEPGNVNCVQISPTIQATKSNFTRAHGGRLPYYFTEFEQAYSKGAVIYDQIQSEQGSRFAGKRNRNIILVMNSDLPIYENYKWMTLGQIKELLKIDNLVNMDTRTVLAGLPLQVINGDNNLELMKACGKLNDYKMYHDVEKVFIPLPQLQDWKIDDYGVTSQKEADFCVRHYAISIEGREVQSWSQPLFKATGMGTFVLLSRVIDGKRQFLIRLSPEIGCFDKVEFGPSIQMMQTHKDGDDAVCKLFQKHIAAQKGIVHDVILSEEGGRFYHEQNRNVILEIANDELSELSQDYMWVGYQTLYQLVLANNNVNIQLRNLMALLDEEMKIC